MRIVGPTEIEGALDLDTALEAVAEGFRLYSAGKVSVAAVAHLGFATPPGDCHVKCAHIAGDAVFVVKLATGFYDNPSLGLGSSNGLMLVLSARTGEPLALLRDEGRLTDLRTAMAGAVAARLTVTGARIVGIVGAGVQAELQARYITRTLGAREVEIWARDEDKARRLAARLAADGLSAKVAATVAELCDRAQVIVTTTPSRWPIIAADMVPRGATLIAVGADAPGKQELDAAILASARHVIVDSRDQCIDHGECAAAVGAGLLEPARLIELGEALAEPARVRRAPGDVVVVDLTGVAVQDVQIAKTVWASLAG